MRTHWSNKISLRLFVIAVFAVSIFGWSCASIGDSQVAASIGSNDLVKLDVLERQFLDYKISPNGAKLDDLDKKIQKVLEAKTYNKVFQARLCGLAAEVAWERRDTRAVRRWAETIQGAYPREARLFVALARLEKNPQKKVEILQNAIDKNSSDVPAWLHLELALYSFEARNYKKSALEFDEALSELDGDWRLVYSTARDTAFELRDQSSENFGGGSDSVSFEKEIDSYDAVRTILQETRLFDSYDWDSRSNVDSAFQKLKEEGFFPTTEVHSPLQRSDVAWLLFKAYAQQKKADDLFTQPLGFRTSPIPDVPMSEASLRAVVFWVQRDVMDLPDGVRFFPQKHVSSIEFLKILDRLKKLR